MVKPSLITGTFLAVIIMLGCSGTPENSAVPGTAQQESNSLARSRISDSAAELSSPKSSPGTFATDAKTVRIGSIDWYVNYEDALAEAKRTGRPVWLHFGENPG